VKLLLELSNGASGVDRVCASGEGVISFFVAAAVVAAAAGSLFFL